MKSCETDQGAVLVEDEGRNNFLNRSVHART